MSSGCIYRSMYGKQPECNGACKMDKDNYCQYYYVDPVCTLINDWRREACIEEPIFTKKSYKEKKLYIYTTKPGYLIGYHGKLIDKYRPKLLEILTPEYKEIELVPCDEVIDV